MTIEQGSVGWHQARCGFVTASCFKLVLTQPREKAARERGDWSQTAMSYVVELATERLYGFPLDDIQTKAMAWGSEWEEEARREAMQVISDEFDESVLLAGFVTRDDLPWIGCSPDGFVGDDGVLELKCPYNPVNHIKTVQHAEIPKVYVPQVQGQIWLCDKRYAIYASFDPRLRDVGVDPLFWMWIDRDDRYIDAVLAPTIIRFRDAVNDECRTLLQKLVALEQLDR